MNSRIVYFILKIKQAIAEGWKKNMKQTCKRLALLLTAVLLALSLAACGGEKYTLGGVYSPGRIIPSGGQEQSYEEYVDEATADIRDNPFYESLRAMYYYSYDF